MEQFDVYENSNPDTNAIIPFLLDVQADLLDGLKTRVVIPLVKMDFASRPIKHLNLLFTINQTTVIMSTAELAAIPIGSLGKKAASLKDRRDEIIAALDFIFTGF